MQVLKLIHGSFVMNRRVKILARHLAYLLPEQEPLKGLDVGCGSGEVAYFLQKYRPKIELEGIDVLVRETKNHRESLPQIPVRQFDGENLPFPDKHFDFIMLVDVLHHTSNPLQLLDECVRVAKSFILIKDHFCNSWLDEVRLRFMDWFGNSAYGVALPYNYFSTRQWEELEIAQGLIPEIKLAKLNLYPPPVGFIFDSQLHFMARYKINR